MITRRHFTLGTAAIAMTTCAQSRADTTTASQEMDMSDTDWANLTKSEWKDRLTEQEFYVLRKEGTERPWTSEHNDEKRPGTFTCAGCGLPLFKNAMKFDSGTGWPSFYTMIDGALETKRDFKLIVPRTEYHCSRNCRPARVSSSPRD